MFQRWLFVNDRRMCRRVVSGSSLLYLVVYQHHLYIYQADGQTSPHNCPVNWQLVRSEALRATGTSWGWTSWWYIMLSPPAFSNTFKYSLSPCRFTCFALAVTWSRTWSQDAMQGIATIFAIVNGDSQLSNPCQAPACAVIFETAWVALMW